LAFQGAQAVKAWHLKAQAPEIWASLSRHGRQFKAQAFQEAQASLKAQVFQGGGLGISRRKTFKKVQAQVPEKAFKAGFSKAQAFLERRHSRVQVFQGGVGISRSTASQGAHTRNAGYKHFKELGISGWAFQGGRAFQGPQQGYQDRASSGAGTPGVLKHFRAQASQGAGMLGAGILEPRFQGRHFKVQTCSRRRGHLKAQQAAQAQPFRLGISRRRHFQSAGIFRRRGIPKAGARDNLEIADISKAQARAFKVQAYSGVVKAQASQGAGISSADL
jgi:hypothetical protein